MLNHAAFLKPPWTFVLKTHIELCLLCLVYWLFWVLHEHTVTAPCCLLWWVHNDDETIALMSWTSLSRICSWSCWDCMLYEKPSIAWKPIKFKVVWLLFVCYMNLLYQGHAVMCLCLKPVMMLLAWCPFLIEFMMMKLILLYHHHADCVFWSRHFVLMLVTT